jgi:hypothetical protein
VSGARPWFVSLLLGIAGWVAGLFLLVFVFLAFAATRSSGSALVMGPVLLGAAWALFRADRDGAFLSQLALALSIAGQFLVLFTLGESAFHGADGLVRFALAALVLQAVLVVAMPSALHRTMSAIFACIAWAVLVRFATWDHAVPSLATRRIAAAPGGSAVAAWALAWLPLAALVVVLLRWMPRMADRWRAVARPALVGSIAGLALATVLSEPFAALAPLFSIPGGHGGLALWPFLSALAALGALVAAFALGHRGLMALCIGAALLHLAHFYYALGVTLMVKSLTMIVAGGACLAFAWLLRRGTAA